MKLKENAFLKYNSLTSRKLKGKIFFNATAFGKENRSAHNSTQAQFGHFGYLIIFVSL
jgi:hypothetical protein